MTALRSIALFIPVFLGQMSYSQERGNMMLHMKLKYGDLELIPNESIEIIQDLDTVNVTELKFYLGFAQENNKNYHLFDLSNPKSFDFNVYHNPEDSILQLFFGIDSLTNTSGAFGGDLDPSNGMYWAWQSGYINFKLEGTTSSSEGPNKEFQYHLGGYRYPYNCVQQLVLPIDTEQASANLTINLKVFLDGVDLIHKPKVMSPGKQALDLMLLASKMFRAHE